MLILPGFLWKTHIKKVKAKRTDDDTIYFDHYDIDSLHEILDNQHKLTHFMKNRRDN